MSEAFRGEFYQKVDGKARVLIPVPFRRVLEAGDPPTADNPRPRVVLVYGDARRRFVECYTRAEMARVEDMIRRMPLGSENRRILQRNLITLSVTVEVDSDGRIVLPQQVREKLELSARDLSDGAETAFAGALDSFQLWKADTYRSSIVES
jgi:MraZ protein